MIPGANSSTYTTPTVAAGNSSSRLQVTISNSFSSATSNAVTLSAGPRAPAIGDLRYLLAEQVTIPGLGQWGAEPGNQGPGWTRTPTRSAPPFTLVPRRLAPREPPAIGISASSFYPRR